jgi:hypothetical protein
MSPSPFAWSGLAIEGQLSKSLTMPSQSTSADPDNDSGWLAVSTGSAAPPGSSSCGEPRPREVRARLGTMTRNVIRARSTGVPAGAAASQFSVASDRTPAAGSRRSRGSPANGPAAGAATDSTRSSAGSKRTSTLNAPSDRSPGAACRVTSKVEPRRALQGEANCSGTAAMAAGAVIPASSAPAGAATPAVMMPAVLIRMSPPIRRCRHPRHAEKKLAASRAMNPLPYEDEGATRTPVAIDEDSHTKPFPSRCFWDQAFHEMGIAVERAAASAAPRGGSRDLSRAPRCGRWRP